jgi:hypothetical protein
VLIPVSNGGIGIKEEKSYDLKTQELDKKFHKAIEGKIPEGYILERDPLRHTEYGAINWHYLYRIWKIQKYTTIFGKEKYRKIKKIAKINCYAYNGEDGGTYDGGSKIKVYDKSFYTMLKIIGEKAGFERIIKSWDII